MLKSTDLTNAASKHVSRRRIRVCISAVETQRSREGREARESMRPHANAEKAERAKKGAEKPPEIMRKQTTQEKEHEKQEKEHEKVEKA